MRIIQIIDVRWYNASADFAIRQAQGLALVGHDVLLMANPGSPPAVRAKKAGLNVSEDVDFAGVRRFLTAPRRLRELARGFKADVLFAHRGESHVAAALAARNDGFAVARFRGDVRAPRGDIFNRWLNEKATDGIAVSSELLKLEYERRFRLNGIPMKVLYPGLDLKPFEINVSKNDLKLKCGFNADDIVVGVVGRLSPVKGHRYFIEAAKLVSLKNPQTHFVIAGEDAQMTSAELKRSSASLGVPNMHFYGLVDNIAELMFVFDIGVIASTGSEMIGRVLLEYSAAGLPIIATSVNQLSELLLQSRGGVLIPPADSVAMSQAISGLIEDSSRRAEMASRSRRWAESRSLDTLGRETEAFLREVIDAQ